MSFKKTQDGRVFFKNQPGSANDRGDSARKAVKSKPIVSDSNISTAQILALLKSLNDKLIQTQQERKVMRAELAKYRSAIENIQKSGGGNAAIKADRAERTAQEVIKELAQARRLMAQIEGKAERADQNAMSLKAQILEARQGQKLLVNRQDDVEQKLDDTQVQQTRVLRQMDKISEDRSRFMRKIERIEEAVLQTQDALSAKAMVLLTDQGVAGQDTPLDMAEDGSLSGTSQAARAPMQSVSQSQKWWMRSAPKQMILVALLATGLTGFGFMLLNKNNTNDLAQNNAVRTPYASTAMAPVRVADMDTQTPPNNGLQNRTSWQDATTTNTNPSDVEAVDLNNDAQIRVLMEKDPETLGQTLNEIEPSTVPEDLTLSSVQNTPPPVPAPAVVKPKAQKIPAPKAGKPFSMKPDKNLPDNIKPIEAEALGGSAEAQHDLAAIYIAGHGGVKQSYNRAAGWFESAANGGIANASYNLGVLYHQGLGVDKNTKQAIAWYQKAAEQGHPEAQYNLGIAHIEGIGVPYDAQKASGYFKNAADQGVMEAAYNLGLIYENGLLGKAKPDEALMWYKTAADQGGPEAKQALEQLAKTLNIDIKDINRIADGMKAQKKTKITAPAVKKAPEPQIQAAPPQRTRTAQPAPIPNIEENPYIGSSAVDERAIIAQIQDYLIETGLYPGPTSGRVNPIMRDAIRVYQRDNALSTTGVADRELLVHMLGNEDYLGVGSRMQ